MFKGKSILVFGGGSLQISIIKLCKQLGLKTIVIDPDCKAEGQKFADSFEVIDGNDFEGTCRIVEKYNIKAIITAATDKPLVMMARIAEKYSFPFFPVETAISSTDKYKMKQIFRKNNIPCAQGILINHIVENLNYPLILKPRDNSGSRGVIYCKNKNDAENAIHEVKQHTNTDTILAEEYIDGKEFSIECLHSKNETNIVQITEKITTPLPYNVELGHIQPVELTQNTIETIQELIFKIAHSFHFQNCASHTELKINERGIFIIETSPRLGGDFITSHLVPLSTGVYIEKELIALSLDQKISISKKSNDASAVFYFDFDEGVIKELPNLALLKKIKGVVDIKLNLKKGMLINKITSSLDRYGYFILHGKSRKEIFELKNLITSQIKIN